jgi:phage shock protein PspC (stress-responsive transcriptional regulator)
MNKRLYRSDDPILAGVCGGFAEYFDLDPTLIRILFVILCFTGLGFPIVFYLVALLIMPKKPAGYVNYIDVKPMSSGGGSSPNFNTQTQTTYYAAGTTPDATAGGPLDAAENTATGAVADTSPFYASAPTASAHYEPFYGTPASPHAPPGSSPETTAGSSFCSFSHTNTCAPPFSSPGSAYTTANPQAFDVNTSLDGTTSAGGIGGGMQAGFTFGIIFIGLGLLSLLNMVFHINLWQYWPMILAVLAVFILLTPGNKGWSLERAGNAIFLLTIAILLQFWVLGYLGFGTFIRMMFIMWPVLLVTIGLSIIGAITKNNIFNLFGSLLISASLIFGVWFFGNIPGFSINVNLPLFNDRPLQLNTPASPGAIPLPDEDSFLY